MSNFIPASPGWYVHEIDEDEEILDPIIAWQAATTRDGEDTLLPVVNGGVCVPPIVLDEAAFLHYGRNVVYRPSYDPTHPIHRSIP